MRAIEHIIEELKSLALAVHEAEYDLFARAHEIEINEETAWRADYATFDDLIDGVIHRSAKRYRAFVEAVKELGDDKVKFIGVDAALVSIRIRNDGERAKFVEHAERSREENGKPLSPTQAQSARLRLTKEERQSGYAMRDQQRETREEKLYAENVQLKKKVSELKKENSDLRERLGRIEKSAVVGKATSRKPSAKQART